MARSAEASSFECLRLPAIFQSKRPHHSRLIDSLYGL